MDQGPFVVSEQNSSEPTSSDIEQIEHQIPPEKQRTSPERKIYEKSNGTPPSPKNRYEIMEDPACLFCRYMHRYHLLNFQSPLMETTLVTNPL